MTYSSLAMLPVFLPLVGAALALLAKNFQGRLSQYLELLGAAVGLLLPFWALGLLLPIVRVGPVVFTLGNWHAGLGITQHFDGLAWLLNLLGFCGAAFAYLYARGRGPKGPLFTAIFLIQTAALAATAATADIFNLFVCLEVLGLSSYVLVARSEKNGALLASFSYLAVSSAAMVFFLIGLFGIYRLSGSLSYQGIAFALAEMPQEQQYLAALSLACLGAAVAIRVAVMPVYGWLPDAHALAPHAVSSVLSGVLVKTPLFAMARMFSFLPMGEQALQLIGVAGSLTALVAVIVALSQKDAKRLLAYHSISQIGFITAAWGLGTLSGMTAAFMHALFHALFKGLLFLSVGTACDAAAQRNVYTLRAAGARLKAAGDRYGITRIAFFVGALSIAAIPPFNGFAGKYAITSLFKGRPEYWILFAASIGTVASFIKLSRIFWPQQKTASSEDHIDVVQEQTAEVNTNNQTPFRVNYQMLLSMGALAVLCLLSGIAAPFLFAQAEALVASSRLRVLHSDSAMSLGPLLAKLWTLDSLLKTVLVSVCGLLIFLLATTRPGAACATLIRSRRRSFSGLVLAFCIGLFVLASWLVFPLVAS